MSMRALDTAISQQKLGGPTKKYVPPSPPGGNPLLTEFREITFTKTINLHEDHERRYTLSDSSGKESPLGFLGTRRGRMWRY